MIGDSISEGYRRQAEESLGGMGIATEWFSGGSSAQVLAGLPEWIPSKQPDLIQFNCGLHDARYFGIARTYQQLIGNYELLLRGIVRWLQANTDAGLVSASTTRRSQTASRWSTGGPRRMFSHIMPSPRTS